MGRDKTAKGWGVQVNSDQEALAVLAFGDGYQAAVDYLMNFKFHYIEVMKNGEVQQYINGIDVAALVASMKVEPEDM